MIPSGGEMLVSYLNTLLRDRYPSLEALCEDGELSQGEIEEKLASQGYFYDEAANRVVAR